jgi:hypothetical protein
MPSYEIARVGDLPAVVMHFMPGFDFEADFAPAVREVTSLVQQGADSALEGPVCFLVDATHAPPPTLKGIVEGADKLARRLNRQEARARIDEIVLIAPQRVYQLAAQGLNSETFGWINMTIFESYASALDYLSQKFHSSHA